MSTAQLKTHAAIFAAGAAVSVGACYASKSLGDLSGIPLVGKAQAKLNRYGLWCEQDMLGSAIMGGLGACAAFWIVFQSPLTPTLTNSRVNFA